MANPASDRTKWRFDAEFMCAPQMQNSIPSVSCGEPYTKKIDADTNHTTFAVYRESNLEKNYTWQPHFGMNVGLTFDFVDQDALVNKTPAQSNQINDVDKKLFQHSSRKGKSKVISDDGTWWLRNPVYQENNLYDLTNNFTANMADEAREMRDKMNKELLSGHAGAEAADVSESIFTQEYVDKSFDDVKVLEQKLRGGASSVEYSIPLLPHAEFDSRTYSAVRYELDPLAANIEEEELPYHKQDPTELAQKRARMRYSVGMNSRSLDDARKTNGVAPAKNNIFAISMVAPELVGGSSSTEEAVEEAAEEEDDLFGDDSDGDGKTTVKSAAKKRSSAEISGASLEVDPTKPYSWVKDFKTEVRNKNLADCFALFVNGIDSSATACYLPLKSQMIMTKLPYVDKSSLPAPQEVAVSRSTTPMAK